MPLDGIVKDGPGFQRTEAASLPQGEYPFNSSIAFVAAGSLAAFSPQDAKADHPFRKLVIASSNFIADLFDAEDLLGLDTGNQPLPECRAKIEAIMEVFCLNEHVGVQ
jgi:hypothetical protein